MTGDFLRFGWKMKKLVVAVLAFLFFLFACYLAPSIKIADISPDFVLMLLAVLTPHCGVMTLLMVAVILGVAIDTTLSGGLYLNTVIYLISAIAFGIFRLFMPKIQYISVSMALASAVIFKYFISMFALYILNIHNELSFLFFIKSIPAVLYNVILAIPFVFIFEKLFSWKLLQEKGEENFIV